MPTSSSSSVLPKDRSFTASAKGLPPQTQEPRLQFYQGLIRCGSFSLFFALHSLFSIWTDLKRSEKIPRAPAWRWGEWIGLTGPSRLHRNSPQGLNISSISVFDQIRDPEIPITLRPLLPIVDYFKTKYKLKDIAVYGLPVRSIFYFRKIFDLPTFLKDDRPIVMTVIKKSCQILVAVLPKGSSSTANSGTKVAVLLGMNRYGSFPLLSATHSLFSIWANLKRSEKIPSAPTWKWGEWIWLTGPSGLYRNWQQGLNVSSIRVLTRLQIRKSQSSFVP